MERAALHDQPARNRLRSDAADGCFTTTLRFFIVSLVLILAAGCGQQSQTNTPAHKDTLSYISDSSLPYGSVAFQHGELEGLPFYRLGMDRERIQMEFGGMQLEKSLSRPKAGWKFTTQRWYDCDLIADAFENKHPYVTVDECDVYHVGNVRHFMFYNSTGQLIGFHRDHDLIYLWWS